MIRLANIFLRRPAVPPSVVSATLRSVLIGTACACCSAQSPSVQAVPVIWNQETLIRPYAADGLAAFTKGRNTNGLKIPYPEQDKGGTLACIDNTLYICTWSNHETPSGSKGIATLYQFETTSSSWVVDISFEGDLASGPMTIIPLKKENSYLAFSYAPLKIGDGKGPFAILKKNAKGKLEPVSAFDADLTKPVLSYPAFQDLTYPPLLVMTDESISVVDTRTGYFFVFESESGKFKRSIPIFDSIDEKRLSKNSFFADTIVGLQPKPDGKVLIASREEDLVLHGMEEFKSDMDAIKALGQQDPPPGSPVENGVYTPPKQSVQPGEAEIQPPPGSHALDLEERLAAMAKAKFSKILWWELDPLKGKLVRLLPPPPGAEETWEENWSASDFAWRWIPTLDGQIHLVSAAELGKSLDDARLVGTDTRTSRPREATPTFWLPPKGTLAPKAE